MDISKLNPFTQAYIEAALWSSTDHNDEPLDSGNYDLAEKTLGKMIADCAKFQEECIEWIAWDNLTHFPHRYSTHEKAGHDFWLTRCGHGAGFWDGDWIEPAATKLTEASERFGNVDLYVGDDGLVYQL